MKKLIIAIDGPAGAGKSTVAQMVAKKMEYIYIDTGAMYRAVTWQALQHNYTEYNTAEIINIAKTADIRLAYGLLGVQVFINNIDVTADVRLPNVTKLVAYVAQIPEVRQAMITLQRRLGEHGGVVMDGRDIGSFVFPHADIKIFMTASIEQRARRRWLELEGKGIAIDFEQLKAEIAERDRQDSERKIAPLIKATDARLIDTTDMSIEQTVDAIFRICEERIGIV